MKIWTTILVSLSLVLCHGQITRSDVIRELSLASMTFVGGYAYGTAETLVWHPEAFLERHPNANPQYWNPHLSWRNKYKNGDPLQGEAYFGSTNMLVWTTDGYHLMRFVERGMWVGALTLTVTLGEKKGWKYYVWSVGRSYLSYMAGFHLSYRIYEHNR
jgi:hypothetical protein